MSERLSTFRVVVCVVGWVFACAAPTTAQHDERVLELHADIEILEDGSIIVAEKIRVRALGQKIKHGIYRDLPNKRTAVLSVRRDGETDGWHTNDPMFGFRRYYIGRKGHLLPAGEYTYDLRYRVKNEIRFDDKHDELYWNVADPSWEFPIDRVFAEIRLPRRIDVGKFRAYGYQGREGQTDKNASVELFEGRAVIAATRPLQQGEGLTIDVEFPKGLVEEPTLGDKIGLLFLSDRGDAAAVVGFAIVFFYLLIVWFAVGRDPQGGMIHYQPEPPEGISPAAMRYIRRMGFDNKTFATALIDMAAKGFLAITQNDKGKFEIVRTGADDSRLAPEEKKLAKKLFKKSDSVVLSKAEHMKLSKAIDTLKNALANQYEKVYFKTNGKWLIPALLPALAAPISAGLLKGGERAAIIAFLCVWLSIWTIGVAALLGAVYEKWKSIVTGAEDSSVVSALGHTLISIPFLIGEIFGLVALFAAGGPSIAAVLLLLLVLLTIFHRLLKAPTHLGRNVLDRIEGFKLFLSDQSSDLESRVRNREAAAQFVDRYLPYAVALDCETRFAERLNNALEEAQEVEDPHRPYYRPIWWHDPGSGRQFASLNELTGAISGGLAAAVASAVSTGSGGSSSGFGGGGSVGGGGGGGGGGW